MIANKDKRKERMKQSKFIPLPEQGWMWGIGRHGDPISMGEYRSQFKTKKKKR